MKKTTLLILVIFHFSLFTFHSIAQSCLPQGITFTTQAQIDNFQPIYPYCTEIEGDVIIIGEDITNLTGLSVLTSIHGNLKIGRNYGEGNPSLNSISGLENLISIGGSLSLYSNGSLTSLTGLDNVATIGGNLSINANHSLVSLAGLENLISIEGDLQVDYNNSLTSLAGLGNVISIGGDLIITRNDVLSSLVGMENINSNSINNINIIRNNSLTNCAIQNLCEYLQSPIGSVNIYNNASGCNNPPEIASAGGFTMPCLPFGNYHLVSQSDIDNFENDYPGCTEIEGNIEIKGADIINLEGLNSITNIAGNLSFYWNEILTELNGLENLKSIGGNLELGRSFALTLFGVNPKLNSLSGLNNLSSIGGNLTLLINRSLTDLSGLEGLTTISGNLSMVGNSHLTNLSALSNMTTLGGDFKVEYHATLTSLTGMEWLTSVFGDVRIVGNDSLSNLTGLDNLAFIGGGLYIEAGSNMTSLSGLENLESVGGGFGISSALLSNFSELSNLTSIGGKLGIYWNDALTSLSGLENIDANSISILTIRYNPALSTCEVQSICNYLAAPNGTIEIHNNAPGCNSGEEVKQACDSSSSVGEINSLDIFIISPNPCSGAMRLRYQINDKRYLISDLYSISGQKIRRLLNEVKMPGEYEIEVDLSEVPAGVYVVRLQVGDWIETEKLLVY